jgi:hypothetical protein
MIMTSRAPVDLESTKSSIACSVETLACELAGQTPWVVTTDLVVWIAPVRVKLPL